MPGYFEPAPQNDKGVILIYKRTSISTPEKYAEYFLEKENIQENIKENIEKNIENKIINRNKN